jgi:hypothetical protein
LSCRSFTKKIISRFVGWGKCWGTIALVVAVPYWASIRLVQPTAEEVCCRSHYASKAAATVGHWVEENRCEGWRSDSFLVTFHVADAQWQRLSHAEQADLLNYLAEVIMRPIPEKTFLIRDDQGDYLANGGYRDARFCGMVLPATMCGKR